MLQRPSLLVRLLDAGVDASVRNTTNGARALYSSTISNRGECVTVLICRGIDLDAADRAGDTALHWAPKINHFGEIYRLLAAGADPDLLNSAGVTFERYLAMTNPKLLSAGARRDLRRIQETVVGIRARHRDRPPPVPPTTLTDGSAHLHDCGGGMWLAAGWLPTGEGHVIHLDKEHACAPSAMTGTARTTRPSRYPSCRLRKSPLVRR